MLFVHTTHRILIIIWFALQVGAFKIFVSPSWAGPLDLTLATHDLCFADGDVTSYRYDVLPGEILFDNGFSLKNEDAPSGLGLLSPHISGEATAGDCVLTRCPPKAKV